jgi:hypothetical protein
MPSAGPTSSGQFQGIAGDAPERGLFRLKPSAWWVFHEGWPTWTAVAVVVVGCFLEQLWTDQLLPATRLGVFQFGLAAILARVVYDVLGVLSTEYTLTDRRATARHGVLHPVLVDIPLDEIEHVELRRSLLQRITGTGTLYFYLEGITAPAAAWEHVRGSADVREAVMSAVERVRRIRRPGGP